MRDSNRGEGFRLDGHIMFSHDTEVLNISIGGAALSSRRKLDVGSGCRLELEGSGDFMLLEGIVAWCVKGGGPSGGYKVGMQFTNIYPEKMNEIVSFIEKHKKSEESRLGGLRFTIFSPDRAVLHHPTHFMVRDLALEGLTIEGREELEAGERLKMEVFLTETETIDFVGEVSSSRRLPPGPSESYEARVGFSVMSERNRARLGEFIKSRPG